MNLVHDSLMATVAVVAFVILFASMRTGVFVPRIGDPIKRKEEPYKFILAILITTTISSLLLWFAIPGLIIGLKGL